MSSIGYTDDDGPVAEPSQLQTISELVKKAEGIKQRITNGESLLATLKQDLKIMLEETIPSAMDAAELSLLKTDTGLHVEVKSFMKVSIPAPNLDAACAWLENNNHGEIIKTQVIAAFGKGKLELAKELSKSIPGSVVKREVNWQTLNSWAREATAPTETGPGLKLPDLFSVYSGQIATINNHSQLG